MKQGREREARVCEYKGVQSETKRREATFGFVARLTSKRPVKQGREREVRVCEYSGVRCKTKRYEGQCTESEEEKIWQLS